MPRRGAIGWLLLAAVSLGAAALPFAKGPLEKVDLAKKRLVIREPTGARVFAFTDKTYFYRGQQKLTPDQLTTGEVVAIRFRTDGTGQEVATHCKTAILPPEPAEP
jgi:hypothetical protein